MSMRRNSFFFLTESVNALVKDGNTGLTLFLRIINWLNRCLKKNKPGLTHILKMINHMSNEGYTGLTCLKNDKPALTHILRMIYMA